MNIPVRYRLSAFVLVVLLLTSMVGMARADASDARLRDVAYDPHTVVNVPVRRGTVTLILLDGDETIEEVATGLGADCSQADAAWCIAAQAGGRSLFIKPKSSATAANNLTVLTDRRSHSFRLSVLADHDPTAPVYRLTVHAPAATLAANGPIAQADAGPEPSLPSISLTSASSAAPALPVPELLAERLQTAPKVVNAAYSLAEGASSEDIVPTLVFDDGRFTYLRFPGNRPVPAVFNVLGDGSETVVNTRMEGDLLVVDLVSRRLTLRAGTAVVGIWNDAFDLGGASPTDGTTVPGVRRVIQVDEHTRPHNRTGAAP